MHWQCRSCLALGLAGGGVCRAPRGGRAGCLAPGRGLWTTRVSSQTDPGTATWPDATLRRTSRHSKLGWGVMAGV